MLITLLIMLKDVIGVQSRRQARPLDLDKLEKQIMESWAQRAKMKQLASNNVSMTYIGKKPLRKESLLEY